MSSVKYYFDKLLPILWLRPESALWYSHMLAAAEAFPVRFDSPSMEFGCMDGINSLLLLGGEVDNNYDVFREVQWHETFHRETTLAHDYYDKFDPEFVIPIRKRPKLGLDFGVDWKESHLEKARRLNIYRSLTQIDLSFPKLPNYDDSLESVWAPNLYWTTSVATTLGELRRVLRPGSGSLFTILPDISQLQYMIYNTAKERNKDWLSLIDRGRFDNVSSNAKTLMGWVSTFESSGFTVIKHKGFIPDFVARVYDVGFRPMFPVLLNIYQRVSVNSDPEVLSLKEEWIERMKYLSHPLIDYNDSDSTYENYSWHMFELKKA